MIHNGKRLQIKYKIFLCLLLSISLVIVLVFINSKLFSKDDKTGVFSFAPIEEDIIRLQTPPPPPIPPEQRKLIVLTFDDGPSAENTDKLLAILKKYDVKTAFFVLGNRVELYPDILKRIHESGNEIGSHSYSHPDLTKLSPADLTYQLQTTNNKIEQITKAKVKYLRPPYGIYNQAIEDSAKQDIVLWNVDSQDWKLRDCDQIVNQVLQTMKPHSIILFHDLYDTTIASLDILIPMLQQQGYEFITISEFKEITNT